MAPRGLPSMAEAQLAGAAPDRFRHRRRDCAGCFVAIDGARTDVVVLGCTHYPLLLPRLRLAAPCRR